MRIYRHIRRAGIDFSPANGQDTAKKNDTKETGTGAGASGLDAHAEEEMGGAASQAEGKKAKGKKPKEAVAEG